MSLNKFRSNTGFEVSELVTTADANIQLKGSNVEIGGTCFPGNQGTVGQILTVSSTGDCGAWEDPIEQLPKTNLPGKVLTSTVQEGQPVWQDLDVSAVQNITATAGITTISGNTITDNLQFKAQDSSTINLNPANRGLAGYFLATDGLGDTYWQPDGAGAAGITQTAVPAPTTALNKVALYNSNDGLTVKDSNLQYTGLGWNFSGENINNVQSVQTSALSTVAPATDIDVQSDLNMGTNQLLSDTTIGLNSGTSTDIKINSNSKLEITDLETTISNDLRTDIIIKNLNDNVNIEGCQYRTGGLSTINELTVLDAIDVSNNVISNVSDGVIATDAVNKSQLDTKLDKTGGTITGTLIINDTLTINNNLDANGQNIDNAFSVDTQLLINSNNPSIIIGTNLSLQANKATSTYIPVDNVDLTNKLYVDNADNLKINLTEKGASSGICPLDSGVKIPSQYLPDLAITQVYVVADDTARDAIALVQQGDVAIVANPANNWIWTGPEGAPTASGSPPNYDWVKLVVPTGTVTSVNSFTGTVALETIDIPETVATLDNRYYTAAREAELFKKNGSVAMTGNLNMGANEITNATQITTGILETISLTSGGSPSINVFNDLSISAGSDIKMNGQNIINVGNVECDTLSSATATSINVNHDLVMAGGEFLYTGGILGPTGASSQIFVGSDLVMGSKKVVAGVNTFDSNGLSCTTNLIIKGDIDMQHQSPGTYFNGIGGANTNFFVNNVLQDTQIDVIARRSKYYPSLPIPTVSPGRNDYVSPITSFLLGVNDEINFNTTPGVSGNASISIPLSGLYKIDFMADVSADNDACLFQFELRIGGIIKKTCTMMKQKDRIVPCGLTTIEPVSSGQLVEIYVRVDSNTLYVYNYNMTVQRLRTNT